MEKCQNIKRYQGIVDPKCDDGRGCRACWKKRCAYLAERCDELAEAFYRSNPRRPLP